MNDLTSVYALRLARVISTVMESWRTTGPDTVRNAEAPAITIALTHSPHTTA